MVASTYPEAIRRLLLHEGGYTNDPRDPGGPTNFGITLTDYRKYIKENGTAADVKNMSIDQARAIYRNKYWVTTLYHCDELPPGVDYSVFDYGVNSGVARSGRVLRRVCGLPDNASNSAMLDAVRKRGAANIVDAINDERLAFLKRLKTWPTFGKGWGTRVGQVRNYSLQLAGKKQLPIEPTNAPGKGEISQPPVGKIGTGAAAGTAAAGAGFWPWVADHPIAAIVIVLIIGATIGLIIHTLQRRRQKQQIAAVPNTPVVPELVVHAA